MFDETELFHGGKEIFVWGMIGPNGGEALIKLEGKINSTEFIK